MENTLNLGDLRKLVERLEGQSDEVGVEVIVTVPGLQVSCPTSNWARSESRPLEVRGSATSVKVRQMDGYHVGYGPAAGVVIFGVAG